MKEFKIKIKYDFSESLVQIIQRAIEAMPEPDQDEQLFIAAIREVQIKIKRKQIDWRPKFQLTLSPVQALALRMLYTDCIGTGNNTYEATRLQLIANEIHQHYS